MSPSDPRVRRIVAELVVPALLERLLSEHQAAELRDGLQVEQPQVESAATT